MRKSILYCWICAFCFTIAASCSKNVKSPYAKSTTAAKTTSASSGITASTPSQGENTGHCGGNSTSGSGSSY